MTRAHNLIPLLALLVCGCNIQVSSPGDIDIDGSGATRLPPPSALTTISLDKAVHLRWDGGVVANHPAQFRFYRVYSSAFSVSGSRCSDQWDVEGTTVSDGFLVSNLRNGETRCFAVTTVAQDGGEGSFSTVRSDTPRPSGTFVLIDAVDARPMTSGWLFSDPVSGRVGVVGDGMRTDLDFRVERRIDGSMWLRPVRSSTRVLVYGNVPIPDLSFVDRAPSSGYSASQAELLPGYAYVFSTVQGDGIHFGAIRVAFVGQGYVVLDWSYQVAPNNVELTRM